MQREQTQKRDEHGDESDEQYVISYERLKFRQSFSPERHPAQSRALPYNNTDTERRAFALFLQPFYKIYDSLLRFEDIYTEEAYFYA